MGTFAIRSEGNNVTNYIVGSNGVRNVRNERPPVLTKLRERQVLRHFCKGEGYQSSDILGFLGFGPHW